jgi:hypothetical protein
VPEVGKESSDFSAGSRLEAGGERGAVKFSQARQRQSEENAKHVLAAAALMLDFNRDLRQIPAPGFASGGGFSL